MTEIATRRLGSAGPVVSAIGLGCTGMSDLYGPADDAESAATISAALDAGVTLLDTGDYYGMGHNELLIRNAVRERDRDRVVISVKFGALRDPADNWLGFDGRPAAVKTFLAYTLRRLGTDYVDIYRPGRLDPVVPIDETVGAIGEMVKAGHVRHVGLSESAPIRCVGPTPSIRFPMCSSSIRCSHVGSKRTSSLPAGSLASVSRRTVCCPWPLERALVQGASVGEG